MKNEVCELLETVGSLQRIKPLHSPSPNSRPCLLGQSGPNGSADRREGKGQRRNMELSWSERTGSREPHSQSDPTLIRDGVACAVTTPF